MSHRKVHHNVALQFSILLCTGPVVGGSATEPEDLGPIPAVAAGSR